MSQSINNYEPVLIQTPDGMIDPALHSISYLRVSTKAQATRDGEPEGLSIPAQREAVTRKAIIGHNSAIRVHFDDKGESARSADRPGLQAMLRYLQENRVDYVFVHKLDRLARNRRDDLDITLAIQKSGAKLVSCSENIDETPSGTLMHGIMSSFAEFYSRNLANESRKGMREKAKRGGTPGKVPFGYRNVHSRSPEGFLIKTVEADPDRAPMVTWLFETYAEGVETAASLAEQLRRRGITTMPTPRRPEAPIATSHVAAILKNRYYVGVVRFEGTEYPGSHQPLVSEALFARVQEVREERHQSRQKPRVHNHYLKGTVHCGSCGEPLSFEMSTNRVGTKYEFYYCLGRQRRKNGCTFRALQAHLLEQLVEKHWQTVTLSESRCVEIRRDVLAHIDTMLPTQDAELAAARQMMIEVAQQSQKLLDAHYADAISIEQLKSEQQRLALARAEAEAILERSTTTQQHLVENLNRTLALLQDAQAIYRDVADPSRRSLNQAMFEKLYVVDDEIAGADLNPAVARLTDPALDQILRTERKTTQSRFVRTKDLSGDQGSLDSATEVVNLTVVKTQDLPSKACRDAQTTIRARIHATERPRGHLPWEMKEPRPLGDRGSNELTLVGWLDSKWNQVRAELLVMSKIVEAYQATIELSVKR